MTTLTLKYIHSYKDRHGKRRNFFRKGALKKIPLPGLVGSKEFMDAYQAALEGSERKRQIGVDSCKAGSMSALISAYYQSIQFKQLKPSSKRSYTNILERLREATANLPVASLQPNHIRKALDARADRPGAARSFYGRLRVLMSFAVERGYRADNPMANIKRPKVSTEGFHTWDEKQLRQFESHFPIGTKPRLAFDLLLYTAQRRSDVVRMGPQDVREDAIFVNQKKTGTKLLIPIHKSLALSLSAKPSGHLSFLVTEYGKPFSEAGFTSWFRDQVTKAGLPLECKPHGLRKAAARRLAEAGCTAHEIMAITGHRSIKEVDTYTRKAGLDSLGRKAISRLQ